MTRYVDAELESWRQEWAVDVRVPDNLERRVHHRVRMARLEVAVSLAITIIFGAGLPWWAIASQRVDVAILALGVWKFLVIAWLTSLTLGKGTWKPAAQTTAAFLEFSILSCRRNRQAIAAAAALYVALLTFVLIWKYQELSQRAPLDVWTFLTSEFNLVVWLITIVLAFLAVWRRRVLARELHNLVELQRVARA